MGLTNWDTQLSAAYGNGINGKVVIGWFAATPTGAFSLANGKMVDIKIQIFRWYFTIIIYAGL